MTFSSAKESLVNVSLSALPGLLAQLEYVAGLWNGERYLHWGLSRIFGEESAAQAIAEVHRHVYLQVLRTPLRRLEKDLERSARARARTELAYAEELWEQKQALLPHDRSERAGRHFSSVLRALSGLARRQAG